jgi:hypothetical protein
MKIFALLAAMILYISFAMQNAVQVINYPNHGVQLPMVKILADADQLPSENADDANREVLALNR